MCALCCSVSYAIEFDDRRSFSMPGWLDCSLSLSVLFSTTNSVQSVTLAAYCYCLFFEFQQVYVGLPPGILE